MRQPRKSQTQLRLAVQERRHTATVIIVNGFRTLVHWHELLQFWMPVGGGLERGELPHQAALRETKEECGLDVVLYDASGMAQTEWEGVLRIPHPVALLDVTFGSHHWFDHLYFATSSSTVVSPGDGVARQSRWVTAEEIADLKSPVNLKFFMHHALDLLAT